MRGAMQGNPDSWLRVGFGVLVLPAASQGGWALFAPRSFFDSFPGLGHQWVALLPPYNEHLTRDVGAFNLAFAVLFAWTAVVFDRRLARAALVAYLVYAVAHVAYHITHLMGFPPGEATAQMLALGLGVALPLALLIANAATGMPRGPRTSTGSSDSPSQ